jgi:hypothetical protein
MRDIKVTVLRHGQPTLYNLSWMAKEGRPPQNNSHYDNLTGLRLDSAIREHLSFGDDAIQKIKDEIDRYGLHDQWYRVDDATYGRLFG